MVPGRNGPHGQNVARPVDQGQNLELVNVISQLQEEVEKTVSAPPMKYAIANQLIVKVVQKLLLLEKSFFDDICLLIQFEHHKLFSLIPI